MKVKFYTFLFALLMFQGISAQNTVIDSIYFGGIYRNYRMYVPAAYNSNTAVPLVLNFHGYTSSATEQQFYSNFMPIADTANFLVLMPNGTRDNQNQPYWNVFGGSGGPDDIAFTSALIDSISAQYSINPNRIYSTGMSNGGFMSYELACQLSHRIAAIASVTGSMITPNLNNCNTLHPMPVMEIHGTADGTVPYIGGSGFTHIDTLVKHWVTYNNCNPTPVMTNVPNTNTTDGCTAEHYVWSGGDSSTTVELFKIIGGGHTWPGALFNIGVTNQDFNASAEIWRFFSQYTLNGVSTSIKTVVAKPLFSIYPNPATEAFTLTFADNANRTITVTNSMGQVVQKLDFKGSQTTVNVDAAGLYFITVVQGNNVWTEKVVKH